MHFPAFSAPNWPKNRKIFRLRRGCFGHSALLFAGMSSRFAIYMYIRYAICLIVQINLTNVTRNVSYGILSPGFPTSTRNLGGSHHVDHSSDCATTILEQCPVTNISNLNLDLDVLPLTPSWDQGLAYRIVWAFACVSIIIMSVGLYPRGLDYHDLACNINFTRSRIRSSASSDGGLYTLTSSDKIHN